MAGRPGRCRCPLLPNRGHLSVSDEAYGEILDALLEHERDPGLGRHSRLAGCETPGPAALGVDLGEPVWMAGRDRRTARSRSASYLPRCCASGWRERTTSSSRRSTGRWCSPMCRASPDCRSGSRVEGKEGAEVPGRRDQRVLHGVTGRHLRAGRRPLPGIWRRRDAPVVRRRGAHLPRLRGGGGHAADPARGRADPCRRERRRAAGMSVGVHTGTYSMFLVGGSHRELLIGDPRASQVVAMESVASAGQILLQPGDVRAAAGQLPRRGPGTGAASSRAPAAPRRGRRRMISRRRVRMPLPVACRRSCASTCWADTPLPSTGRRRLPSCSSPGSTG